MYGYLGVHCTSGCIVVDGIAWEVVRRSAGGAHGCVGGVPRGISAFAKATDGPDDATELRSPVLDNPPRVICNCDLDFFPITILTKLRITLPNYA